MIEISDTRVFDQGLQEAFAALSSDYNPKHVDPARARSMFFGRQVVHGLHLVCWSLDQLAKAAGTGALESVRCTFTQACEPGQPVTISGSYDAGKATIEVRTLGARAARFVFTFGEAVPGRRAFAPPTRTAVRPLAPQDIEAQQGAIPLTLDPGLLATLFPHLAARGDTGQIAVLLASTRLVGMECPGLNSIFTGLKLQFDGEIVAEAIDYAVTYWSGDLRLLTMSLAAEGLKGSAEAILHPDDVAQPRADEVAGQVRPGEFSGQHALVIGGSRGLGETVAKIVALGGGQSTITYHSAVDEARRVQSEITAAGGLCDVLRYDAMNPAAPPAPTAPFTQIYYFATPRIRPDAASDAGVLAEYSAVYSQGQHRLLETHRAAIAPGAVLYYPSTVFVEQPDSDFAAYARAKLDGEDAARSAAQAHGLGVVVQRLPRLRTGQSSALMGEDALETLPQMLDTVRQVARCQKERAS